MKFSQELCIHKFGALTGAYTESLYEILLDGEDTGIQRQISNGGPPDYKTTEDVLFHGSKQMDLLNKEDKNRAVENFYNSLCHE